MEEHGEMQSPDISGAIEALLFVSDEPVGALTIAEMLEVDLKSVEAALDAIRARLEAEDRGVQLREVAGGWRFYTHPRHHGLIEKYVLSWDTRKLTQAALETLAVIAYNQPITRAGVTSVRGVNSDSPINSLVEKGLVRDAIKMRLASRFSMPHLVRSWKNSALRQRATCRIWKISRPMSRAAS